MKNFIAIIPARAGSVGIKDKNIIQICDKPLLAWSIYQAKKSKYIQSVWVSSDGDNILEIAESFGAGTIKRPDHISGSDASSESAWNHAINEIEKEIGKIHNVVGLQPTSPIREPEDIDNAINYYMQNDFDSLLTVSEIEDYFIWEDGKNGPHPVNYNLNKRMPRQKINKSFLENGSFYIFKPEILKNFNNRLGGNIGIFTMAKHKMFQIDNHEDIKLCEAIMRGYSLDIYE